MGYYSTSKQDTSSQPSISASTVLLDVVLENAYMIMKLYYRSLEDS
jgi:hypothetical protein